jgi:hypothetical protein
MGVMIGKIYAQEARVICIAGKYVRGRSERYNGYKRRKELWIKHGCMVVYLG